MCNAEREKETGEGRKAEKRETERRGEGERNFLKEIECL